MAEETKEIKKEEVAPKPEPKQDKPKKEGILAQAKKMAESKKTGKPEKKEDPKKEVKKGPARVFTIPLKVGQPRMTKTRRAVKQIRLFVEKHTKQEAVIDEALNELMWSRGRKKPPASIRVSVETSEDNKAVVSLKK
ncbi:MAG: 50S ribosomal protein L31e [Candidatus Undinarchaeales archaeon]|jgi:ribosomal protein L31E|nr:50S ribosomal protein L31e [Candidatus Undinarchaeales archaeon]